MLHMCSHIIFAIGPIMCGIRTLVTGAVIICNFKIMLQVLIMLISPRFNFYEKRHQLQHLCFSYGTLAMSGPWNFSVQQELEQQPLNMALLLLQQELAVSRPVVLLVSSSYDFHIPKPKKFVFHFDGNSRKQYSYLILSYYVFQYWSVILCVLTVYINGFITVKEEHSILHHCLQYIPSHGFSHTKTCRVFY